MLQIQSLIMFDSMSDLRHSLHAPSTTGICVFVKSLNEEVRASGLRKKIQFYHFSFSFVWYLTVPSRVYRSFTSDCCDWKCLFFLFLLDTRTCNGAFIQNKKPGACRKEMTRISQHKISQRPQVLWSSIGSSIDHLDQKKYRRREEEVHASNWNTKKILTGATSLFFLRSYSL